jgi:hypothetical protein
VKTIGLPGRSIGDQDEVAAAQYPEAGSFGLCDECLQGR